MKPIFACVMLFVIQTVAGSGSQSRKLDEMMADELFVAWQSVGESILVRAFPTNQRFEVFRADFRGRVLTAWEQAPHQPVHAVFMLDVAMAALARNYPYWADFIKQASVYVRGRAEPPGANPAWDAFEIQWHKTAVALLSGRRKPELVADEGVGPLMRRMAPVQSDLGALVLIDPWITLARGFAQEGFTIENPSTLEKRGPAAVDHYRAGFDFPSTRPEATVRAAWLLFKLKRTDEALKLLENFDDAWTTDGVIRYWRRLFLGKALEAAGRVDDATRAYQDALKIAPAAQAPRTSLMLLELTRGNRDESQRLAENIRTTPDPVVDPWWSYHHGDLRFLTARLKALKAMVPK